MTPITINVKNRQYKFLKQCANDKGLSLNEYLINTVEEKIEDEAEFIEYNLALEEYKNNPITYSL